MDKIQIDRNYIEMNLLSYADKLLALPEVEGVKLCDIVICNNENKEANVKAAINKSYHDIYSDSDICIIVNLPVNSKITPLEYMKHPSRFGITPDKYLGFVNNVDSGIYRIIFRDGTRYDFGFEFTYDESYKELELLNEPERYSNSEWPIEKIDEFWFVMIQALGKLYRKDYLISSHLTNININETLVQQMILRDAIYGTNHHRYGYGEELIYRRYEEQCPFRTDDDTFNMIAKKLYAAALAYDNLSKQFYPEYEMRSNIFFGIWKCYDEYISTYAQMKLTLVRPTIELKEKALDYRQEHFDYNEMIINGSELLDKTDSYEEWLKSVSDNTSPDTVSSNWVVTDTFFAMDENQRIIGIIDLRHTLNDFLKDFGNSGYSVRPSERRKGYATEMLRQILLVAKQAGMQEVHLSVERSNEPSVRTIIKNGGKYERSFEFEGEEADIYKIVL